MFDMQKFARFLLQKRKEKNITQGQLAEEVGVSTQAVSKWERGEAMPEISKLADLAVALDVTTEDIMSAMDSKDKSYTLEEGQAESLTEADEAYLALADKTLIGNVFELAPHLSQNVLKTAIVEITSAKGSAVAKMLFRFASEDTLRQCAVTVFEMEISEGKGDVAPYLPQEKLAATLLNSIADGNMARAIFLLPYCNDENVVDAVFTSVVAKYRNWNHLKDCIGRILPSVVVKQGIEYAVLHGPACFDWWWGVIGGESGAKLILGYTSHFNNSDRAWRDVASRLGNVDRDIIMSAWEQMKADGFDFTRFKPFYKFFPPVFQNKLNEYCQELPESNSVNELVTIIQKTSSEDYEERIPELEEQCEDFEDRISELEDQADDFENRISELEEQIEALQQEIESLKELLEG